MSDCQRPECNGVGEYIPGAKCIHEPEPTPCAYAELYCRASISGPEEWIYCEADAEEGGEYCDEHRDCEKGNYDE